MALTHIQRTFEVAAALGDDLVHDPDHHGTSEQRVTALRAGYATASADYQQFQKQSPGSTFLLLSAQALKACSAWPADSQRGALRPLKR